MYLSNIDCRVEWFSNIHDDVSPDDVMVAGQAVDLDDGAGGPVGEVAERLAAVRLEAGNRFWLIIAIWGNVVSVLIETSQSTDH